ncbi:MULTISPECIES: type III secretion protein [Pseudomonas]|uniref:type III secretion protein n=1 Tax=Pseudomonas TaxID=286 RepID=UPI000CFBE8F3|nr:MULTISPECIES: type III secretion protein [Pseudomonas]PQZ86624.1 type III secretion protein [Pseudomonas trivialis]PRB23028.1 type III secretion protein [Pseudomonas sp. MYb60]
MNKDLMWVQWWFFPWKDAHHDWYMHSGFVETAMLSRTHHHRVSLLFEIEPELPSRPCDPIVQWVLTCSAPQQDLALLLVKEIDNPSHDNRLNREQHLWCQRLTKALTTDVLFPANVDDPLHYLRAWVSPAIWQRLRLSFARQRVLELESHPRLLNTHGRLDTIWQAALWRATSSIGSETLRQPS